MKPREHGILFPLVVCVLSLLVGVLGHAQEYSHARIVRLSFVEGMVMVQRPDVADWAMAPVNTPLQEGFKLSTAEGGFAEAEFENTSTARLGQLTLLEFTQLALLPSGGKVNRLTLQRGYATVYVIPERDDLYQIETPFATFTPHGEAMFRVDVDPGLLRLAVFKGSVELSSPFGSETLSPNMVLELTPGADQPLKISEGITKDAWDRWVEQRQSQVTMARNYRVPFVYSNDVRSILYGWSDLNIYGVWSQFPGYGYGWVPNVPAGWSPYASGRWCWYSGFGYTWISSEPWGWLPYHYGEWAYVPRVGWCWLPGNLGVWSPALVTWYQGPGWIGWAPATCRVRNDCQPAPERLIAVDANSLLQGRPVTPSSMLVADPAQASPITSPDIPPSHLALLPGPPVPQTPDLAGSGNPREFASPLPVMEKPMSLPQNTVPVAPPGTQPLQASPASNVLIRSEAAGPGSGIAFDPVDHSFVNSPGQPILSPIVAGRGSPMPGGTAAPQAVPAGAAGVPGGFERNRVDDAPPRSGVRPSPGSSASTPWPLDPARDLARPEERHAPSGLLLAPSWHSESVTGARGEAPRVQPHAPREFPTPAASPNASGPSSLLALPASSQRFIGGRVSHPGAVGSVGSPGTGGSTGGHFPGGMVREGMPGGPASGGAPRHGSRQ